MPSGKKFVSGKVVSGEKEGSWTRWYETGEYLYHKNRLNGFSTQWFKDGKIQALARYKDDQFVDILKFFFRNGKLNYMKYFASKGLHDGDFMVWHENGNISQTGRYTGGKEDGEWKTYYENGKLETVSYFKLRKEIGDWITYNSNGKIIGETHH